MIRVQAILQMLVVNYSKVKDILINLKIYFSERLRKEYFLTIIAASICDKGKITISSAGHSPVLYFKKKENAFDLINPKGIGIGFNDRGHVRKNSRRIGIKSREWRHIVLLH